MRRVLLLFPFLVVFVPAPAFAWGNCSTHPHDCGRTTTTTAPSTTTVAPTTTTTVDATTTTTVDATSTTHATVPSSDVSPASVTATTAPGLPMTGASNVTPWALLGVALFVIGLALVAPKRKAEQ